MCDVGLSGFFMTRLKPVRGRSNQVGVVEEDIVTGRGDPDQVQIQVLLLYSLTQLVVKVFSEKKRWLNGISQG